MPRPWLGVLNDDEIRRADSFFRASDRLTFVAAHVLKRLVLAQTFPDRSAKALRFVVDSFGKPCLTEGTAVQFNLSHTTGLAALAVSFGTPIGIDVEALGSPALCRDAMRSVLTFSESAALERTADWECEFLVLWTAKEAVIKAEGKGLSLPLAEIEICHDGAFGPSRRWALWRSRPTSHHVLTLAWIGSNEAVENHPMRGDDLTASVANEGARGYRAESAWTETARLRELTFEEI